MSTKQWNKCNSQRQAISICPNMHKSWALPLTLFFPDSAQVISSGTKLICLAAQSCLTLCEPINCSPPGSSVHGIFFPGKNTGVGCHFLLQKSSWPRDQTCISDVSFIAGIFFTNTEPWGKSFYSGRFSLNLQPLGWVLLLWGLPRSVLAFKTALFLHHDFQWTVSFLKAETMSSYSPLNPSTCLEAWHKLGAQCMFVKYATL